MDQPVAEIFASRSLQQYLAKPLTAFQYVDTNTTMKNLQLTIICILFSFAVRGQDPYLIPDIINLEDKQCQKNSQHEATILQKVKELGLQTDSQIYNDHVMTIDLNGDNICEYILKYYDGGPNIIDELYLVKNAEFKKIGWFWEGTYHWLKNEDENYPLMLLNYYEGHKTNPIWKFKVLKYDSGKYIDWYAPDMTYGELKDAGLKAYTNRNYDLAEIYFSNVLTVFGENPADINNLAITLIKQNKTGPAEDLLLKSLKKEKTADTLYNLSLIYKHLDNQSKELEYLLESNKLKPTEFKADRISKLKRSLDN